jgi:hypothetical protein
LVSERPGYFYRFVVVDADSGEILALTESQAVLGVKYELERAYHSTMFQPVPIRPDRAGFYVVKGIHSPGAQTMTTVRVSKIGSDELAPDALPPFRYRGQEIRCSLAPDRLSSGPGKAARPYWMVRTDNDLLIGGFISDENETVDDVARQARALVQSNVKPVGIASAEYPDLDTTFFVVAMDDGSIWSTSDLNREWEEGRPLPGINPTTDE